MAPAMDDGAKKCYNMTQKPNSPPHWNIKKEVSGMTITQMQYFRSVCEYENFTKAAEAQHISQPAMSAAMKELETECGVPLFKKTRNSLTITDAGWALLEEIHANLMQYDHLMHAIKDLSLRRNYIRVGVATLNGNLVYPQILSAFTRRYPDIQVISSEEPTDKQFELLNHGKLDVAINGKGFQDPSRDQTGREEFEATYHSWPLMYNEMVFCVPQGHPLAMEPSVTLEQIVQEPLVLMEKRFGITRGVMNRIEDSGLSCRVLHYTDQMYSVERFVEQGAACGILPKMVVDQNPLIVGLSCDALSRGMVSLHWRKDQKLFSSTKAFISLVKELYPKQPES